MQVAHAAPRGAALRPEQPVSPLQVVVASEDDQVKMEGHKVIVFLSFYCNLPSQSKKRR